MPQVGAFLLGAANAFGAGTWVASAASVASFSAGFTAASWLATSTIGRLLTSVALSALSQAMAPKPRPPGIKTTQTQTGGTNPVQFILGRYATAGYAAAPAMSHGKAGKTPNAYLTYVIEVSDAPVSALNGLIIDGTQVAIGSTPHADYGLPILGYLTDRAWVKFYDGTQVTADPMLVAKYADYPDRPWSADMIGRGLAYVILTFRYDSKIYDSLPSVRVVVDGLKLYDPRKDSSVGGSGAHRWATPSTWEFSRNPIVMAYNIKRGITLPDGNRWGGTCTADDLPLANWTAAMNVCDVSVTLAGGGTVARYTAGFEASVDDEPAAVIEELLKACNGQLVDMGGIWKVRAGGLGLPVYFFTDDDIIATRPEEFDPFPGLAETFNGISATYPEPSSLWESREAPPRYNATWEAEDGGRRLVASLSLPAVTHWRQVQHLMQAAIKDHRRMRRHNLTLTPAAAIIEPLDVVSWTSARNGYSAKQFEVAQVAEDLRACLPQIAIREVDPTDYDWSSSDELPSTPAPGGVTRPAAQAVPSFAVAGVSVTDATGTARRPAFRLTWDGAELDDAEAIEWEVRLSSTLEVVARGSNHNVEAGQITVTSGILPGTAYQGRARLVVQRARAWTAWLGAMTPDVRVGPSDIADTVYDDMEAIADLAGITTVSSLPATGSKPNQIVMLLPPGELYRWDATGGVWTRDLYAGIKPGDLTVAAFASGIRPLEIVASLPTSGNFAGRMVFLTTDSKIYRHTGSPAGSAGFTKATDGADIIANSITAGQIAAAAIGTDQLAAGAVIARHLAVSDFANLCPDYDLLDAGFWSTNSAASFYFANTFNTNTGARILVVNASADAEVMLSGWFPIEAGAQMLASGSVWVAGGFTGTASLRLELASMAAGGALTVTRTLTIGSRTDSADSTRQELNFVAAADEVRARFRFVRAAGGTGSARFGGPRVNRRANGKLIVDGEITADKMAANSVTTDKLAANAVVASKLATGELITLEAQIKDAIITNAKIKDVIQSSNYVAGSAGWRINKDGTAQFQNLVVRAWLQSGAVTDTFQTIASANYAAPGDLTVRATLDLGATNRGDIYKRGLVFEARAPTSGVNVRVLLQRRSKSLGAASFTAWETVETIIVNSSLHSGWTMFADSSTLCGYYDDFEYRLATEAYQSVAPYNPSSAYDATVVIRQIYLTLALVTR